MTKAQLRDAAAFTDNEVEILVLTEFWPTGKRARINVKAARFMILLVGGGAIMVFPTTERIQGTPVWK